VMRCHGLTLAFLIAMGSWWAIAPTAFANAQMTLYLNLLPHRLTGDSSRQFDLLIDEILARQGQVIAVKAGPLVRTGSAFKEDPNACVFPASLYTLRSHFNIENLTLITSKPVEVISLRLYLKKGSDPSTTLDDLRPQRVGHLLGSVAASLNRGGEESFKKIATESQLIMMLERGRLDAFIGHHPDTSIALEDLGQSDSMFVASDLGEKFEFTIHFVCKKTPQTVLFLKGVNEDLQKMYHTGRLREILGPYSRFPNALKLDVNKTGS